MAQDIVPIELGLTQGDVVTLWAPRWREEGEEWEAFLGHEEDLYAFPDAAHLAAFVRTTEEHDLTDHPAWHVVPALSVGELSPDDNHQFDLVGVPELVAEEPDTWVIGELADVISIVRSLADVCELEKVHEILDSAEGFALLPQGTLPFTGREGQALWTEISQVVAEKWDEVLDAIDEVVTTPEVDETALKVAQDELAEFEEATAAAAAVVDVEEEDGEEPVNFWGEVGIDPIKIISGAGEYYTLRCYLDDHPVFLGRKGRIDVFTSPRALARFIVEADDNDLAEVSTWGELVTKATGGDLDVEVDPDNVYVLTGLDEDIVDGPDAIDPTQLDLVVELLEDAGEWAGDDTVKVALNQSERLGWLVSYVLKPDPTRLAPSAPFDDEQVAWRTLVAAFEDRLRVH
ncbi:primosomal protein [Actinosynnema sp. NPDC053489]|uniref:primosomal protein n=1 Tax=Actinosynnema sp. NPDC053489 TaxID=3363916 RepID=UPI0037C4F193